MSPTVLKEGTQDSDSFFGGERTSATRGLGGSPIPISFRLGWPLFFRLAFRPRDGWSLFNKGLTCLPNSPSSFLRLKHIKLNESKTLRTFEYGYKSLDLRETRELTERLWSRHMHIKGSWPSVKWCQKTSIDPVLMHWGWDLYTRNR